MLFNSDLRLSRWKLRSYVSLEMFSKSQARTRCRGGKIPSWEQVFLLQLTSVARLDLVLKLSPGFGPEKSLGAAFVDIPSLSMGVEMRLQTHLPRGGLLDFSVCPVDFDPSQNVSAGYLPLSSPLQFPSQKNYKVSMKTGEVIDLEAGKVVFRWRCKKGRGARTFSVRDLSDTPLIHMKCSTRLGQYKYRTHFGSAGGPLLCNFIDYSQALEPMITMAVTNPSAGFKPVTISGNWHNGRLQFCRNKQIVASSTRQKRNLQVSIQSGEDIVFIIASAIAAEKVSITNRKSEIAFFIAITLVRFTDANRMNVRPSFSHRHKSSLQPFIIVIAL